MDLTNGTTRRGLLLMAVVGGLGAAGCSTGSQSPPGTPTLTASAPLPTAITPAPSTAVATGAVPTVSPGTAAATSASALPTVEPTLPYGTAPASAPATGRGFQLDGVRVGAHPTYDRVVVDLSGAAGAPPWSTRYVAQFTTQGQGAPVDLPGDGNLLLTLQSMAMPTGNVVRGDLVLSSASVTGVYVDPWFEGQVLVMVGVDKVRSYRVFTLESPTRIVVDVQR